MRVTRAFCVAAAVCTLVSTAPAEEKFAVVVGGLKNPSGVAVQPGSGQVFVSDSGALRILKLDPANPKSVSNLVTGFSEDIYGKGPMYKIGPLGLAFIGENNLVVGDGGHKDGEELVYVFDVSKGEQKADDAAQKIGPIKPGEGSAMGEGNFYAIGVTKNSAFFTSNGDDTKGWILSAAIEGGKLGELKTAIATKPEVGVDAPVGITVSPQGNLVVGQSGEVNVPKDSLLTAYDASGKLLMKAETGLHDIVGLAFSPASGKLYAVDFAWVATDEGGLYRLDISKGEDGKATVKAEKVAKLDRPTALAFGKDGSLFVTVFGVEGSENGGLVKFGPGL